MSGAAEGVSVRRPSSCAGCESGSRRREGQRADARGPFLRRSGTWRTVCPWWTAVAHTNRSIAPAARCRPCRVSLYWAVSRPTARRSSGPGRADRARPVPRQLISVRRAGRRVEECGTCRLAEVKHPGGNVSLPGAQRAWSAKQVPQSRGVHQIRDHSKASGRARFSASCAAAACSNSPRAPSPEGPC